MAFGNFWRGGGRERYGSERDQDVKLQTLGVNFSYKF